MDALTDPRVALVSTGSATYPPAGGDSVEAAIARAAQALGLADERRGPLGRVIPRGARVVIKPNLVLHENRGSWGLQPLVTHPSLIQAAADLVLQADPAAVVVGDAPIQSCDFGQLLAATGLDEWSRALESRDPRFKGVRDFRRTTCEFRAGVRVAAENRLPEDRFVLFDLASDSLLEPITDKRGSFRVTCYDPRLMARTHAPGRHRYLIARDIVEADVVVNLPKLKTHMKAGITCALKNLVGINGNKEFLPHHRVGGASAGGDCYPGGSVLKRALEFAADRENASRSRSVAWMWHQAGVQINRMLRVKGDRLGIEGAWSGNDTVWRTCLDLNRILLYGRPDGTLAREPVRRVVHIVDGIVAGQGNGPLSAEPLPLGAILVGTNAAAIDWVGAQLLGYDPERLPIVREAFGGFRWPLTSFDSAAVHVLNQSPYPLVPAADVRHPDGWRDAARQERLDAIA